MINHEDLYRFYSEFVNTSRTISVDRDEALKNNWKSIQEIIRPSNIHLKLIKLKKALINNSAEGP